MQYIRKLLDEAAALTAEDMSPEKAPKKEIQLGDRLLGVLPEDVRRFYYLFAKRAKVINPRMVQIRHEAELLQAKDELTPEKEHELQNELNQLHSQRDLVEKLFWEGVKESVPGGYGAKNLGVRKDWQVVEVAPEPEFPGDILGPLFAASILRQMIGEGCEDPDCPVCHQQRRHESSKPKGGAGSQ